MGEMRMTEPKPNGRTEAERAVRSGSGRDGIGQGEAGTGYQNPLFVGMVLLVAGVAVAMIQSKVPTIMTALMAQFSMDAQLASWLMSIFTLASIVVALPSGMLAARFGAKKMMVVACGIAVVGSVFGLLAPGAPEFIASRAVEGAALTVLTTCGPIVVRQCVRPEKIGIAMGVWGIWGCVGSTAAALLAPTLFEAAGFSGVWAAFAVVAALAAVLVAVAIRVPRACVSESAGEAAPGAAGGVAPETAGGGEAAACGAAVATPDARARASAGTAPSAAPSRLPLSAYRPLLRRDVLLFFVGFAVFNICLLAVLSYVPTILQMQGFDPTLSGFVSTAPMLLSVVSSPLFGGMSDRLGRTKPLLVASMLVMGPCTFLLYTQTGALLWVAVAVMGLVGMGGIGMFLAGYAKLVPDPALAAGSMGVMIFVQGLGQFLGSYLVQMLLGPQLDQWLFAGAVVMALGLAGTVSLALCRLR